ncbi:MAG TPA: hypothetical protein VLA54_07475 [Acidimicrobiia bacterium]|nr:hypothetical protein [Acidimicrobiia bacterium]
MSGWRAGLIAVVLGGVVLAIGWVLARDGADGPTTTTVTNGENADVTLSCPLALQLACDGLASNLGTGRSTYRGGVAPSGTVVVTFAADLPPERDAQVFARTPIAIAVWGERASVLIDACGTVTVACVVAEAGTSWDSLGGPASWGTFLLGLADPNEGRSDLEAWRLVAAAGPAADLGDWVRLRAADDGQLLADLVLFPSRADAVIATEAAIASQLENARNRAGRLTLFYPDPSPYVEVAAYGEGRAAANVAARLLEPELQNLLGSVGLRPPTGDATNLLRDLGTPGVEMPALAADEIQALIDSWTRLVGG